MLRIEFQFGLAGVPLRLFEASDAIKSIEIDNALPVAGDDVLLFLTIHSETHLSRETLTSELPQIDVVDVIEAEVDHNNTYYLSAIASLRDVSVLPLLTEHQAIPHRIVAKNAQLEVIASVQDWNELKDVAGAIEAEYGSLELIGTTQTDRIGFPLGSNKIKQSMSGKLSDKQLQVLEAAYQMGYFKVPQEVTAEEIATELNISRATLSERLRRVQHNFCELLFGPQE